MKIRMPAKKLANADVNFISLVERGANRAPFKIQKQERSMINFGFTAKKGEQVEPQASIVGYVVMKDDGYILSSFEGELVAEGEVVVLKQDKDTVLKTGNGEVNEELIAVKLSPDFAVVLKGFDPYKVSGETSFTEVLKAQGFMPGFSMAAQALVSSINSTMAGSESSKEAATKVGDALDEFGEYVHGLVKSIPNVAFQSLDTFTAAKAEVMKASLSAEEKEFAASLEGAEKFKFFRASPEERAAMMGAKKPAEKPADKPAETEAAAAPVAEEPKKEMEMMKTEKAVEVKKEMIPASSAVDNGSGSATSESFDAKRVDGNGGEPSAAANMSVASEGFDPKTAPRGTESPINKEEIAKMISQSVQEMAKALSESLTKTLTDAMSGVQKQVKEIATSVEAASTVAKEASNKAAAAVEATKKMDQTLTTTVLGGDAGGDPVEQQPAKKMEGEIGAFDTAFNRSVRKVEKAAPARRIAARLVG